MIRKFKHIPDLLLQPLRATSSDLALLRIPAEVSKALKVNVPQEMQACEPAINVETVLQDFAPDSVALFMDKEGKRYPCWLEGDENLGDDWLTAANYYPHYFRIYKHLGKRFKEPRLLEFGVRSGYSAVVFAKAMEGKACHYTGVDPNLYIPGGLKKASETFRILQAEGYDFRYFLLEGFSSSENIQKSLQYSGPFDMIHVDGEHTYFGKIYDLWIAAKLLSKGGFVLVDDFEHHGMIADSIKAALQMGWFSRFSYFPTKRGMAVLSR